jgi:alkylation response protein AidB-like acyl-CoA dehydrogenase
MTDLVPIRDGRALVDRVRDLVPWMQQRAPALDDAASFPADEIAALRDAGALAVPLPIEHGGDALGDLLMQLGRGNLSVGRIVEAHVNARHLIARYGTARQKAQVAADLAAGHLFALWVTDPPTNGLRMATTSDGIRLNGGKMFCSAAGFATRAVVTAADERGGSCMLVLPLDIGERVRSLEAPLQGMRAAVTGVVDFTGCSVAAGARLGAAGDYLREPDFSTGAWRSSAVAAGGLQSITEHAQAQLTAAGRMGDPHQLQRMGMAQIACETSRLWSREVASVAEDPATGPAHAVAYTGLARIAVETACLEAMTLVQRSLGIAAFRRGNPVERICRDLATYLRQPAPDAVLTEAAAHFAAHRSQ